MEQSKIIYTLDTYQPTKRALYNDPTVEERDIDWDALGRLRLVRPFEEAHQSFTRHFDKQLFFLWKNNCFSCNSTQNIDAWKLNC